MGCFFYYMCFIDDYLRFTWVYLMLHRSDICHIYADFITMVLSQFNQLVKVSRFDVVCVPL